MSDLLTCIPDAHQIPFLLRRGSPVLINGHRRIVSELLMDDGSAAWVAESRGAIERAPERGLPALDLTDETGRWHAARWCNDRREYISFIEQFTVDAAIQGRHMTPTQIDTLARLVLRLAGRTP
jgi:hypothetical protein